MEGKFSTATAMINYFEELLLFDDSGKKKLESLLWTYGDMIFERYNVYICAIHLDLECEKILKAEKFDILSRAKYLSTIKNYMNDNNLAYRDAVYGYTPLNIVVKNNEIILDIIFSSSKNLIFLNENEKKRIFNLIKEVHYK